MEKTRVSTPQAPQTAPAAHTTRNKASAQAAPDDAGGGAGGFLSLLSALGDSMDSPLGSAIDPEILPADDALVPGADAAALMAWLAGDMPPPDAGQGGSSDVAGLTQGTSTLSLAQGHSLASLETELLPSGGLVAQTARLDNAADTSVLDGQNATAGYRRAFSRMQSVLSAGLAGVSTTALAANQRSVAGTGDKSLTSAALAAAPGQLALPERREATLAGAAMLRTGPELAAAPALAAQVAAASAPDSSVLARSSGDRAVSGGGTEVWGGANAGPEAMPSADAGSTVAEPGQAVAEEALAEQVAYWVSENLQNAELTVTHDGKPVEVSVSMSGKEAHIVFGSDQRETRDLLDASVAQLRDLLHAEGLTLSGVTVGGSGARNANSEGGGDTNRGRQGGRQAQVLVPVAETGAARPRILTDRAVDVFV